MNSILITGGAGFIGANFVKYMRKQKNNVKITVLDALTYAGNLQTLEEDLKYIKFVKGSINDSKLVANILTEEVIDTIINFAAESHVDRSIENPQIFLETNIIGTQNLLDCAKKYWQTGTDKKGYPTYKEGIKFVQVSTDEVYGSLSTDFIDSKPLTLEAELKKVVEGRQNLITFGNEFFHETTPLAPCSPYSASKASADMIVASYGHTFKLPYNITRCSNNYGAYQFPEKLIPLVIKNILEGKSIPVYGKGENVRDWLYVDDHCKAIAIVAKNAPTGEVYNIGGFNEAKNIDIVRLIIKTIADFVASDDKYKALIKHDKSIDESLISYVADRLGHDARYAINPSKTAIELGWYPETSFDEGIIKTVKWYLDNQDWVQSIVSKEYERFYNKIYQI